MSVATTASRPTVDRSHVWLCVGLWTEFVVAFGILMLSLAVGTLAMPSMIVGTFMPVTGQVRPFLALPTMAVVLGWCGLVAIVRLLYLVCSRKAHDRHPRLTLSGVAAGLLLVGAFAFLDIRDGLTSGLGAVGLYWLPLACTAHVLYLARRALFAKPSV